MSYYKTLSLDMEATLNVRNFENLSVFAGKFNCERSGNRLLTTFKREVNIMQYIEKYTSLDEILERIDLLKQEENYYEEDFNILGLEDLEPDWTDYMGCNYNPHSKNLSFKDFFTQNAKAEDFLNASGLNPDLVSTHLKTLENGNFLLAFDDDSLNRDVNRSSVEADIEKGPGDNL